MRQRIPTYFLPVLLVAILFGISILPALADARALRTTPFATRSMMETRPLLSQNDIFQAPALPDTMRVLAIRVEFAEDTLMTTTGDGSFFYELPEDIEAEDWLVDPPPHDSSYFADQLLAMRNYYSTFSRGQLTLTGHYNDGPTSGGDIYPRGEQAAYRIDYPIWHVNYGDGDNDRLNETLTQLFVDAWSAANADTAINIAHYDLFLIFHAGAGNEFDTGYDTTPHDIPSVVIGPTDLADFVGLPGGVPMRNGNIMRGAILPETQRQEGVDVGMLGTVCAQVGFLLGMPHMYNTENGDPGIGLLGLMDRGFGGYFGLAPTPPSAWMRAYMGWDPVTTITEGEIRVGALHLPDQAFVDDPELHRLVRVPINENEYYLVESRRRDPDDDSLTVAIDRDGDRLLLHDDYTIELDPANTGEMTAPVIIEDHDFDLPASGMLIWHIDESMIRDNIANDQIQNDRNRRGVDLEEADGTEDIGEEYEFLQAGDGAEYGVREDAWYRNNELWSESNNVTNVRFGSDTYPNTAANSGGATHIEFTNFSDIADTMTAEVMNTWKIPGFPVDLPWVGDSRVSLLTGQVDGDGVEDILIYGQDGKVVAFAADGTPIGNPNDMLNLADTPFHMNVVYRHAWDIDGDDSKFYVQVENGLLELTYLEGVGVLGTRRIETDAIHPIDLVVLDASLSPNNPVDSSFPHIAALYHENGPGLKFVLFTDLDANLTPAIDLEQYDERFGYAQEGWIVPQIDPLLGVYAFIVSDNGAAVGIGYDGTNPILLDVGSVDGLERHELLETPVSFGEPRVVASLTTNRRIVRWSLGSGASTSDSHPSVSDGPEIEDLEEHIYNLFPLDVDGNGIADVSGIYQSKIMGFYRGGVLAEGTPIQFPPHFGYTFGEPVVISAPGGRQSRMLIPSWTDDANEFTVSGISIPSGRALLGFPLDFGYEPGTLPELYLAGDGTLLILSRSTSDTPARLIAYTIPMQDDERVAWGGPNGDNGHGRFWRQWSTAVSNTTTLDLSNAYAWPNPAYDKVVHLRFEATRDGRANLKVYDLVGRLIDENDHTFSGTAEGAQEIAVDVSNYPSGVYVARLEAGGQKKMIRFAVVQ
ncbi:T9SS type A sorting domain-containing protein [bacterium]|nr:T9SS type A sorting domain-containing protein [bacterium]